MRRGWLLSLSLAAVPGMFVVAAQTPAGRGGGFVRPSVSVRQTDPRAGRELMTSVLGWRLGVRADQTGAETFWAAAANADAAGLGYVEAIGSQAISPELPKSLDSPLTDAEADAVASRLDELRLRVAAYRVESALLGREPVRRTLALGKRLGAPIIVLQADPAAFADLDAMAEELNLRVAVSSRDAERAAAALTSRSERLGLALDFDQWLAASAKPAVLSSFRDRVWTVELRDRPDAARLATMLSTLAWAQVPARLFDYPPPVGHDGGGTKQPLRPLLFTVGTARAAGAADDLKRSAAAFDAAVRPAIDEYVDGLARITAISRSDTVPADERARIAAAIPRRAPATPRRPRKLLVLDLALNGSFYHGSTALGNLSIQLMSENTTAFTPVFSNDLANLAYPAITQFDGVFLNQIQGNVFDDDRAIAGLVRFVREGGGVAGLHAATWASPNVPEFGELMGATSGAHKYNGEPGALRVDDPKSPLTRQFGGRGFEFLDEFYHYVPTGPYSRERLHVLLSLDPARHELPANQYTTRPDNDYGMVWIREYGKGRVFNCGLGHRPEFYEAPAMQQMVLAGIQFVLGDLAADATPSGPPNATGAR